MGRSRGEGEGSGPPTHTGNLQVAIIFLREILVWTPLEKQLDHLGLIATPGRSVQPSLKYLDDQNKYCRTPLTECSGSVHDN